MFCAECEAFELRRDHPVRWALGVTLGRLTAPSPYAGLGAALGATLGAAVGQAPKTHYELHREEYARTGAPLELERMLRAVRSLWAGSGHWAAPGRERTDAKNATGLTGMTRGARTGLSEFPSGKPRNAPNVARFASEKRPRISTGMAIYSVRNSRELQ